MATPANIDTINPPWHIFYVGGEKEGNLEEHCRYVHASSYGDAVLEWQIWMESENGPPNKEFDPHGYMPSNVRLVTEGRHVLVCVP